LHLYGEEHDRRLQAGRFLYLFREEGCVMVKGFFVLCVLTLMAVSIGGCATSTPAQRGAASGAAVGAITGQIVGKNSKSTMIGAGVGALGGALLNDAQARRRYDY